MAKGLRSKSMRKNRTRLRETIMIPAIKLRQEKIAKAIEEDLKQKSGNSISLLKKSLVKDGLKSTSSIDSSVDKDTEEEMSLEYDQVDAVETEKKRKGSKPRRNPNKVLSWFPTSSKA